MTDQKKLTDERIDEIFDAFREAPTMEFRYLVARAIETELSTRQVTSSRELTDEQIDTAFADFLEGEAKLLGPKWHVVARRAFHAGARALEDVPCFLEE